MGIQPERLKEVFNRYERGVPMKNFGGLGLGLYIVQAIVEAHEGVVRIESRPNQGTLVIIELPRWRFSSSEEVEPERFSDRVAAVAARPTG